MAQHQQPHPPRTRQEALQWAARDGSGGFKDAALLNKLELSADETGIMHVGCAYGAFAIAASRVLNSLTPNPANIVGVDRCRALLDLASTLLDDEATRNHGVRNILKFRRLDAFSFGDQENIDMIQSLFPRGISTIVVTDIFKRLGEPATYLAIRNLTALLRRGGRIVFDVYYQPLVWSAVHCVDNSSIPPRLVGIVNLASPRFQDEAEQQARSFCDLIPGTASRGAEVAIRDFECQWQGKVWKSFADRRGNIQDGIPVNAEATFSPTRHSFGHGPGFVVTYKDKAIAYILDAMENIIQCFRREHPISYQAAREQLYEEVGGGHSLWRLQRLFRRWKNELFEEPERFEGIGSWRAVIEILTDQENPQTILRDTGFPPTDLFYVIPGSVVVSFRRE